jgi:hypothetical protein
VTGGVSGTARLEEAGAAGAARHPRGTLRAGIALGACSDSSDPTGVTPQVIEEVSFNPDLGIDLSQMTKTASGMYIQITVAGIGDAQATAGSDVDVSYVGALTTAEIFDAGQLSFTLGAGEVIAGFDEGVTGMKVGERRRLIIPPDLAYGLRAVGSIPPGSILIFDVEVNSIS